MWISVKEHMPEDGCAPKRKQITVFVVTQSPRTGRQHIQLASRYRWEKDDGTMSDWIWSKDLSSVTHWAPFPGLPPKEERR